MPITTPLTPNDLVQAKIDGAIVTATFIQDYHGSAVVRYGDRQVVRAYKKLNPIQGSPALEIPQIGDAADTQAKYVNPSVAERIEFSEMLCDSVVEGTVDSMIICGSPGMGKSRLVIDRLLHHELGAADTITHKGFITPKGLYDMLYQHRNKLIVFDDCDSVFNNETSANILKAALDTYDVRRVSWGSSREGDTPNEFEFEGRMIAISNYKLGDIPSAFTSRSFYTDLTMTPEEKIERIHQIGGKLCPYLNEAQAKECIDLLDTNKHRVKNLNLRTMQMVGKLRLAQPSQWHRLATYMILSK